VIEYLELFTFAWLTLCLVTVLKRLLRGDRSTIILVFPVFYLLFALPLALDFAIGLPDYSMQPGFFYASRDAETRTTYCCFIAMIPLMWLKFLNKRPPSVSERERQVSCLRQLQSPLFVVLVSPIMLCLLSPDPGLYLEYGFIVNGTAKDSVLAFHSIIMAVTLLAVIAAAGIVAGARRVRSAILLVMPFVAVSVWLNGKRAIFAVALAMMILALWVSGKAPKRTIIIASGFATLALCLFSYSYQARIRTIGSQTMSAGGYETFRIDYARDAQVKMALFAELDRSAQPILDYRGESAVFNLTAWIPRSLWPGKPYTYARYFTSAMLNSAPTDWGWAMTTSLIDEAIANCSWFGLVLGPISIGLLCRVGDSSGDMMISLLTAVVVSLLLAVQLVAFGPLFILWFLWVAHRRIRIFSAA
jgi:hypothetical protein